MSERFDFDQLAREVAGGLSRREALRRLGGGLVAGLLSSLGLEGRAFGAGCSGRTRVTPRQKRLQRTMA